MGSYKISYDSDDDGDDDSDGSDAVPVHRPVNLGSSGVRSERRDAVSHPRMHAVPSRRELPKPGRRR